MQVLRHYRPDGSLSGGVSPFTSDDVTRIIMRFGNVIIENQRPLEDSWNHRVAGVGFTHNDAKFAEERP